MSRWAHDVEDRREQILDAAMRVFIRKGIARTTNKDIAREAGITTGLIYYYFEKQDALLQAVIETRTSFKLIKQITPEMLQQPPEIFFPQIIQSILPLMEDAQTFGVLRMIIAEYTINPQLEQIISAALIRIFNLIEQYLNIQREAGRLPMSLDTTLAPQIMAGTLMGFVFRKYMMQDERVMHYTNVEVTEKLTHLVLNGIGTA